MYKQISTQLNSIDITFATGHRNKTDTHKDILTTVSFLYLIEMLQNSMEGT